MTSRRRPRRGAAVPRDPAAKAVVAMLAVSTATTALGAVAPVTDRTPVALHAALACFGAVLAVVTWTSRWRGWSHVGLASIVLGLGVLTAQAALPSGAAGMGLGFTWTGACAAFFHRPSVARGYAAAGTAAFGLGLLVNPFPGAAHVWVLSTLTSWTAVATIGRLVRRLERAATLDPLTGALNRAGLEAAGGRAAEQASSRGEPLTVVVVDLDGFKAVNDAGGHAAGDRLLQDVVAHWRSHVRSVDLLGRLGGDEFVLVLPDTGRSDAVQLMRRLVAEAPASYTFGTAEVAPGAALETALLAADRDLYVAKAARSVLRVPVQRPVPVPTVSR